MRIIEHYSLPPQTRQLLKALDNPTRQAILVLLNECPDYSFTEIQKTLGLEKRALAFHLKKLFSANLISRRLQTGAHKYSYYTLTPLGSQILASLTDASTTQKSAKKRKLSDLAGIDEGHASPEEVNKMIDKLREDY